MMRRRISFTPCIPFHTSSSFSRHHIRPCPTNTGILYRFMCIYGYSIFCRSFHYLLVMPNTILTVMPIPSGHSSGITGFQIVYSIIDIPTQRLIQLPFIIRDISSGFMMSDNTNSLFLCISCDFIHIEIGIRLRIVEILTAAPTFPALIPTFK